MSGLLDMAGELFEFAGKVAGDAGPDRRANRCEAVNLTDRYTCKECDGCGDDSQETGVAAADATDCKECDGAGTMPELREAVTVAWQILDQVGIAECECEQPLHSMARRLAHLILGEGAERRA